MGRWFARFLMNEGHEVTITGIDQAGLAAAQEELGVNISSNTEAVRDAEVVLISVNIDNFEAVVREISPFIRPGQVILDVTSIKALPVRLMQQCLPGADILGTHPVFGPGARDLNSQNFILTPTNESERSLAEKVKAYLDERGSRVSIMTPDQHDERMAVVLGLAHFISIVSADTLASIGSMAQMKAAGGSTYRVLTTLVESVISEDPELYATLQMHLPRLVEIERLFQNRAAGWADLVRRRDKTGFKESMSALKQKYADDNANFGQAYENMYKIMEWL
jgi:prephenate dehydrogenase